MTTLQLDQFDKKVAFVLYFENEDEAIRNLLDAELLIKLKENRSFSHENMIALLRENAPSQYDEWKADDYDTLFDKMVKDGMLKIAIIVSGQGPVAFGMPEMFTSMQHINANRQLKRLATLISDGRYSGVTYGAAIGHMTPEAKEGGGILYLETGDLLYLSLRERKIDFIDEASFRRGTMEFEFEQTKAQRTDLAQTRMDLINKRQRLVAASNRMVGHTDAANGVVPITVAEEAILDYKIDVKTLVLNTNK